jgi:nucleoside 2-deoxyribosyltransferase
MVIYFAGSIRGGRDDRAIYAEIITLLCDYGTVVTEHVGDAEISLDGENASDRDIHDRDIAWLRGADVVVAEVTMPSLGVGYEIGRAVEWGKRVICLYRQSPDRQLSGMIAGCPGVELRVYTDAAQLPPLLRELLTASASWEAAPHSPP